MRIRKKYSKGLFFFLVVYISCSVSFADQEKTAGESDQVPQGTNGKQIDMAIYPIKFYRKFISSVDGNRCRMEPTCSKYCLEAIKKHGSLLGWIMCSDRLMRCGRDEEKLSLPVWINGEKRNYDPLRKNDFWWRMNIHELQK